MPVAFDTSSRRRPGLDLADWRADEIPAFAGMTDDVKAAPRMIDA
jgi:hypothetical protein